MYGSFTHIPSEARELCEAEVALGLNAAATVAGTSEEMR
jgi:hypothetical protein